MVLEEGRAQKQSKEEWIPEVMSTGGASSSSLANVHFMLINCFQIAGGSATGKALSNCPVRVASILAKCTTNHAQVEFMGLTVAVVAVVGALKGCAMLYVRTTCCVE